MKNKILKDELTKANKDKFELDTLKMNEYLKGQKTKAQMRKDLERQIQMKEELKNQIQQSEKREMDHMLKHEFDLLGMNEARHKQKISKMLNRNNLFVKRSTNNGFFKNSSRRNNNKGNCTFEGENNLLLSFTYEKDLTEEERNRRRKEILEMYK